MTRATYVQFTLHHEFSSNSPIDRFAGVMRPPTGKPKPNNRFRILTWTVLTQPRNNAT